MPDDYQDQVRALWRRIALSSGWLFGFLMLSGRVVGGQGPTGSVTGGWFELRPIGLSDLALMGGFLVQLVTAYRDLKDLKRRMTVIEAFFPRQPVAGRRHYDRSVAAEDDGEDD